MTIRCLATMRSVLRRSGFLGRLYRHAGRRGLPMGGRESVILASSSLAFEGRREDDELAKRLVADVVVLMGFPGWDVDDGARGPDHLLAVGSDRARP
jgi:hypothetical protein